MEQITKDQHFVPRFYLKLFAKEGQIQVFDVRAEKIGKPRHYGSVCHEKFFYAAETGVQDDISQAFEDVFGQIENEIAASLPGIIERAVALQLTNNDLNMLAYFMSVQWLRTPFFRERLQKIESEIMEWRLTSFPGFRERLRRDLAAEGIEWSDEKQIEEVKRLIHSGVLRINNAVSLNVISKEKVNGFCGLLLAKKWRIFLSEGPYHFITSDNPVVEWFPPSEELCPTTFMERVHCLSLTPNIFIKTVRPDSMNPEQQLGDRLSYHTANGKEVLMFNKVLANHAHQFVYASQTDEFEQLLIAIEEAGPVVPSKNGPPFTP